MTNGTLFRNGSPEPMPRRKNAPYLYQTIHVAGRDPLRLDRHVALLDRFSRKLFGEPFAPDPQRIAERIGALLDTNRYPATCTSFVRLELDPDGQWSLLPEGISLYDGYALRSVRPTAIVVRCDLPLAEYPTSGREALHALFLQQARRTGAGAVIRSDAHDRLRCGDEAPLFAVKGQTAYTPPAPPSVERETAFAAIGQAHLALIEQEIAREQLPLFDELFYFDHRGITSLTGCDDVLYTQIITERIARSLAQLR